MRWYIAEVAFDPPAKDVHVRVSLKQETYTGFTIGDSIAVSEVIRELRKFDELKRKKFIELDVFLEEDVNQSSTLQSVD